MLAAAAVAPEGSQARWSAPENSIQSTVPPSLALSWVTPGAALSPVNQH